MPYMPLQTGSYRQAISPPTLKDLASQKKERVQQYCCATQFQLGHFSLVFSGETVRQLILDVDPVAGNHVPPHIWE